jgi:methane monooxygenase PmoA-like
MRCVIAFIVTGATFALASPASPNLAVAGAPTIKVSENSLDLLVGDQLVGRYHIDPKLAKPHFHPLNGPFGKPVTRGWPMTNDDPTEAKDHPHQKAVWFCHGDVIPEGMELPRKVPGVTGVDFWAEHANHGWITCVEVGKPDSDGNHAWVKSRNEWQTPDKQKIMDETRVLHLYKPSPPSEGGVGGVLIVFEIDLHASVVPITFGDTKEGSFGVRVAETMTEKRKLGGVLENAEGKRTMKECWGYPSAWCDYSGPVDGKTVGVTIFDDPKNPYPALWHSRDYGLMAANPFGRAKAGFPAAKGRTDLVKLAKGEHLKLRYGLFVHAGDAKEGKVAERYAQFVELRAASSGQKPEIRILMNSEPNGRAFALESEPKKLLNKDEVCAHIEP